MNKCCMYVTSWNPALGRKSPHGIFLDHYGALSKVLSASISSLTPHFISARILSVSDQEEITKQANPDDKVAVLLKKISAALEGGYYQSFHKMLSLMSIYGNNDVKDLSQTITGLLPNQAGMYPSNTVYWFIHVISIGNCMHLSAVKEYLYEEQWSNCMRWNFDCL